jgi:hypothetical protein
MSKRAIRYLTHSARVINVCGVVSAGSIFNARSSARRASEVRPSAFRPAPASTNRMAPAGGQGSASSSPQGCKIVAGGRRPPENEAIDRQHPERVQDIVGSVGGKRWHPFRVQSARLASRRSSLRFDLRLLSANPSGCSYFYSVSFVDIEKGLGEPSMSQ